MSGMLMVSLMVGAGFAASKAKGKSAGDSMLTGGQYTAKVKAIVCGGCAPLIEKAMKGFKDIESVSVNSEASTVNFSIKKGTKVNQSELQKALKNSADKMGMGANYELYELKALKKMS